MINKLFSRLLLSLLTALFICGSAVAVPTASFTILDSDIVVGETFNVQVWMNGDGISEELLAFGFDVSTAGTFFNYDGYSMESGFDDVSSGLNNVAGSVFTGIADNDVLLATLMFTAINAGSGVLNALGIYDDLFFGAFYDVTGYDISSETEIFVREGLFPQQVIPEPGTMLLLGSGFVALFVSRKRRG